jgi:hypothetical protein
MSDVLKWSLPIKESAKHIQEYTGLADANGIESFDPIADTNVDNLAIRADCNRQRHAVAYGVRLNDVSVEYIRGFLSDGRPEKALEYLKEHAINGEVLLSHKVSWDLIPNPSLDHWGNRTEDSDDS